MRLFNFLWNLYPRWRRRLWVRDNWPMLQKLRAEIDEGRFIGEK